jgi:hypothetical protein
MKAQIKVRGNLVIELEEEKQRDLFRAIASAQEVFSERRCGKCQASDLMFRVRTNRDEQEFFELVCLRCRAVLEFGVHKTGGTLFPRRKGGDEGKDFLPDHGWVRWDPERQQNV